MEPRASRLSIGLRIPSPAAVMAPVNWLRAVTLDVGEMPPREPGDDGTRILGAVGLHPPRRRPERRAGRLVPEF